MLINEHPAVFSLSVDPMAIHNGDTLLLFRDQSVLLRTSEQAGRLPLWEEIAGVAADAKPLHAFAQGNRRYFIAAADADAPAGFAFEGIRVFRTLLPTADGALLNAAWHLWVWYREHRFCGTCGGKMAISVNERALVCEHCGHTLFPSIAPAVIMAVTDGDRLLLARNANGAWRKYSLVAGYVEIGETAEQAVRREVLEEVGLTVKNIRYIASQPWGLSQSLMLGFTAELDGSPEITLQQSELSDARWFRRAEIPAIDSTASIAFDLMERFRQGRLGI